ncbi:hypothetical protein ACFL3M_02960 [Patescibacteria group bacterium]
MYGDKFNKLADELREKGLTTDPGVGTAVLIRNAYRSRYARSGKKSYEIVRDLCD